MQQWHKENSIIMLTSIMLMSNGILKEDRKKDKVPADTTVSILYYKFLWAEHKYFFIVKVKYHKVYMNIYIRIEYRRRYLPLF